MQVSVEKVSNLGRRLKIEVPAANVANEEQSRLKDLAKNLHIEGFRRGKVPPTFIKQKYGTQIHQEAVSKILQQTLSTALKEQNLRPANRPNVEDLQDQQGQNLSYTVSFEVFPDINLNDFSVIELEKEVAEISDADIEGGIKKLQDQFAAWVEVTDRPAQDGDKVTVDFDGYLNGEPFEHGSAKNQPIEIGSKTLIPGFEDGLIGLVVDEEKTLDLAFPADYGASHLAGQTVQFKIKVKNIDVKVPATIDADFAARIGIEDKDVAKVNARVKDNMLAYVDDLTKTRLREQALEKLHATNPIEIPDSLLEEETHRLLHEKFDKKHDHDQHDHSHPEVSAEQKEELRSAAKKRLALGLLLNEVISKNALQPDEGMVLTKLASMSVMYGGNPQLMRKLYHESKELRQNVENMVLTDQAADLVVAGATIKEKKLPFYDIVNQKTA